MKVWGLTKKYLGIGLLVVPITFTGCLTDDDDGDEPNTNPGTALSAEDTGTIWNVQGQNKGAYNLVVGEEVAANGPAANKDLVDMAVVAGTGVNWPKTLTSGNGTLFVKASGFDYANATDSSTIKAYAAGSGLAVTPVLANNDIIIAKLRNGNRYAAIKINTITETASDNFDKIQFGYRLTP